MRKTIKTMAVLFAAATIAIFAASCKKDYLDVKDLQITGVKRTINASASMPQGGDKAYLDYTDGRKVKWELTDALNINGTNIALSNLNADPTKAKFEGTTYAIPSGSEDIYWAVYPTNLSDASSGSSIHSDYTASTLTVNFPATQTYDASANALSGNTYMAGYTTVPAGEDKIVFQMRNLGAVLKLHLTADASATNKLASRIEFSTTNGALAGDFTVDNSATPTVTPAAGATQTLTVNLTDGTNNYIDITSGADIYVILPPMASKNLTMKVFNTENGKSSKKLSSATLARNYIYTNTVSDLCFCECGGGDPYFSVSATQQVVFAPGNLQWSATNGGTTATTHAVAGGGTAAGTWRFSENQWDYIGNARGNNTAEADRPTQAAWIDLFGWGTSGYNNKYPYMASKTNNFYGNGDGDLSGTNLDWGVYNAIYNPKTNTTDPAGTWRTPEVIEWIYVINKRTTCSGVRYAKARVNFVSGLIIVPDNWDVNTYALNSTNTAGAAYTVNNISSTDWTNILEPAGCAFLPAAGYRYGLSVDNVGNNGHYWSASSIGYGEAEYLLFFNGNVVPGKNDYRHYGRSVRLVKDI
ncbi:MAG: hypothetical protein IKQ94_06015 [Bacteroidales bacterium]|nr:hypothetical protein [Bacteroidales bacterium]